ncbi:hypothetical protein PSY15_24150, partial [Shigella flexneri]|nr:hypothetical protein [Shigella flexneri]
FVFANHIEGILMAKDLLPFMRSDAEGFSIAAHKRQQVFRHQNPFNVIFVFANHIEGILMAKDLLPFMRSDAE